MDTPIVTRVATSFIHKNERAYSLSRPVLLAKKTSSFTELGSSVRVSIFIGSGGAVWWNGMEFDWIGSLQTNQWLWALTMSCPPLEQQLLRWCWCRTWKWAAIPSVPRWSWREERCSWLCWLEVCWCGVWWNNCQTQPTTKTRFRTRSQHSHPETRATECSEFASWAENGCCPRAFAVVDLTSAHGSHAHLESPKKVGFR